MLMMMMMKERREIEREIPLLGILLCYCFPQGMLFFGRLADIFLKLSLAIRLCFILARYY